MKFFQIKHKPNKPVRQGPTARTIYIYSQDISLQELYDRVLQGKGQPKEAYFDIQEETRLESACCLLHFPVPSETEEEFQERLKIYNLKLQDYEKWVKENKQAVRAAQKLRKQRKEQKRKQQIADLEKRLEKLKKGS